MARIPESTLAEQSVLGAIFRDESLLDEIIDILNEKDFYYFQNRVIFRTMLSMSLQQIPIDAFTCYEQIEKLDETDKPGWSYILTLQENTVTTANWEAYSNAVKDCSKERDLVYLSTKILNIVEKELTTPEKENEVQSLFSILSDKIPTGVKHVSGYLPEYFKEFDRDTDLPLGVMSGFSKIDERIQGFRPSDLIIIAARPSMGKTTYALNIANHIAQQQKEAVLFFSLEMPATSLIDKSIASTGDIPNHLFRNRSVSDSEYAQQFSAAARIVSNSSLLIDETGAIHINDLMSRARAQHRKSPLKIIIVDYIGLMKGEGLNTQAQVSDITAKLKALAKELHIPVLALAQLNRELEKRPNKRPIPSDLRDSGSIEQDADIIQFIYRDAVYSGYPDSTTEIITAKFRLGCVGTDYLTSNLAKDKFKHREYGDGEEHTYEQKPQQDLGMDYG